MVTIDDVRVAALRLPGASERPAPRGGHPQFVANGKCFAEIPAPDHASAKVWDSGTWADLDLAHVDAEDLESKLVAAWRQRAKKMDVARLDYARGREDLADLFAELRSWPELTAVGVGDFHAGGRAFLHFHHYEAGRHADVKEGLGWGEEIPFPLGRPSPELVEEFLAEVRRRLAVTLDAIAAKKGR